MNSKKYMIIVRGEIQTLSMNKIYSTQILRSGY